MAKDDGLSDHTKITIGLCITFLGLAFSMGMAWAEIAELKRKMTVMERIDLRLARIEGKLGVQGE